MEFTGVTGAAVPHAAGRDRQQIRQHSAKLSRFRSAEVPCRQVPRNAHLRRAGRSGLMGDSSLMALGRKFRDLYFAKPRFLSCNPHLTRSEV